MITLANPSSILIEVQVDEADIANILVGQQADIFAVAFPDNALKGEVQSIATTAKRAQGRQGLSFKVKILLSDSNTIAVRPGMSCRAEIYTQSKNKTIAVPSESVIFAKQEKQKEDDEESTEDNFDHVFVLIDGKAVKRSVELGISNDRLQEITSGIKIGDKVITGPARALGKLKDAQSVKVIDKEA